jgi:hypothetical protein
LIHILIYFLNLLLRFVWVILNNKKTDKIPPYFFL